MKLIDTSGHLHHVLCSLALFIHHGLRDFLITGLSSVPVSTIPAVPNVPNTTILAHNDSDFVNSSQKITNIALYIEQTLYKDSTTPEQGWTNVVIGGVLSNVHWGIFLPLILSPFVISRIPRKYLLSSSFLASGILSLFSEFSAQNGYTGLLILRSFQGILQGWCYPLVFEILEDTQSSYFVIPYFFIFLAPWLGSAFGTLLGWADNPFTGSYVMGSMSIILGGVFLISSNGTKSAEKPEKAWVECLTSFAVWSCIVLCMSTVWALHTLLVGLSFTLYFKFNRNDLMWMVSVVILVGGLIARLIAMAAMRLLRHNFLSPQNRRRITIVTGSLIVIACLLINGTSGLNSESTLFGVSVLGVGGGVGLLLVGVRLNLHDLGPLFPTPFLLLGSISGTLGAALASLLFPVLAQIDSITADSTEDGPWRTAWMVPIAPVAIACLLHMFLVSVTPLSHQTLVKRTSSLTLKLNGVSDLTDDIEVKSFKSLKSAISFKTAESRHRSRTVSFQTIADGDMIDIDLKSLPDSKSDEDCVSITQIEGDDENAEMKSVKSGVTSFKSASNSRSNSINGTEPGVILNARELDRTSVWLSTHHDKDAKLETQTSVEKETVERNILIALQW